MLTIQHEIDVEVDSAANLLMEYIHGAYNSHDSTRKWLVFVPGCSSTLTNAASDIYIPDQTCSRSHKLHEYSARPLVAAK